MPSSSLYWEELKKKKKNLPAPLTKEKERERERKKERRKIAVAPSTWDSGANLKRFPFTKDGTCEHK